MLDWPLKAQLMTQGLSENPGEDEGIATYAQYESAAKAIADEAGIPLINVGQVFRQSGEQDLFLDEMHPTPEACRLVADAVWVRLQEILD